MSLFRPNGSNPNNPSSNIRNFVSDGFLASTRAQVSGGGLGGGGFGSQAGFGGGRDGGLQGFGSNAPSGPQVLSTGAQGTNFASNAELQPLPSTVGERSSFGFGGPGSAEFARTQALARVIENARRTNPSLIAGRDRNREERTLFGLDEAVQRSRNQRSLFNDPPNVSTNTNSAFTTATVPTITATTNLTGNGGLFNNRPVYQSMFNRPPPNTSISTFPTQHFTGTTLPNRNNTISGRNSNFSANRSTLQNLNSRLDRPGSGPGSSLFASSNSQSALVQTSQRFSPPGMNPSPSQLSGGMPGALPGLSVQLKPSSNYDGRMQNIGQPPTQNSAFSNNQAAPTKASQIQATTTTTTISLAPVQQTPTGANHQTESASDESDEEDDEEEEEEEYDEEEASDENDEHSTTFAEDLQNLMASHQVSAPEDLFSNGVFTQNLVQFLRGFRIRAPRNKVLYRSSQEEQESEDEINHAQESDKREEKPVQNIGISKEVIGGEFGEKLRPLKEKRIKMLKYKIKKHR